MGKPEEQYYQKVLHFLSFRPRSEKEVFDYLELKIKDKNKVNKIIEQLKKEKILDDEKFVDWWLEQRLSFNPKGKRILRLELLQKGVKKELIEKKLANLDQNAFKKALRELIKKKSRHYLKFPSLVFRQKLIKLLLRRGFNYELVKPLVDEFKQES